MPERNDLVTLKGNPVTLVNDPPQKGQKLPEATLVGDGMQPKKLSDFDAKARIVLTVPSLDTPVCDTEVRKFNEQASALGDDVAILTISVDTPMAQKRWCGAAGVDRVVCLSDFKDHEFGHKTGLRVKEAGLLARSIMVLDRDNTIQHVQLVNEIAEEPDYEAALNAAKQLL